MKVATTVTAPTARKKVQASRPRSVIRRRPASANSSATATAAVTSRPTCVTPSTGLLPVQKLPVG